MKIHLRCDGYNERHARLTLFVNGANVGSLTTLQAEAMWLHHILNKGCGALSPPDRVPIIFIASGKFPNPSEQEINETFLNQNL